MPLLHWATLAPSGGSGIAALRFTAPLRISCIRVFPTGATPFPDLVACTEPEAFFLNIFLNALPTSLEAKEKQRPANALVPTSIAYTGGEVDFEVDMVQDYATRLMIVKGDFTSLSIAIYGDTVETPATSPEYEPVSLPELSPPLPLSASLDPATMRDPTLIAKQLLDLIPNSPKLELVIRLMFCLKPSNDDWDLPEFPYLHADLESASDPLNLEAAVDLTVRPLPEDTSYETRSTFAMKVADAIGRKTINQAYLVSQLLVVSASQHPDMAQTLLQHVDTQAVFDSTTMDDNMTLINMLDAVSNADISRHFHADWFFTELDKLQANPTAEKGNKKLALRLAERIRRWSAFEHAIDDVKGDFDHSSQLLVEIGLDEQSVGIWLETMILHSSIVAKLAEAPIPTEQQLLSAKPFTRKHHRNEITREDFIAFIRAYIGVASVLAVWAWSDSLGNDICRTQTLAIVKLWQGVNGYREIVNHLLLLRQLTRRLQWIITGNEPPRHSGILAEQIFADLTTDPQAILSTDVINAISHLEGTPLAYIAEHERQVMTKMALVAQDKLPAAIEELTFSSTRPLSLRRLRAIRVALSVVQQELDSGELGEWNILEALWRENSHGLVDRLTQMFLEIADDLTRHFGLSLPPTADVPLVVQLFHTGDDLLRLITALSGKHVLTRRTLRHFISGIVYVFLSTQLAQIDLLHLEGREALLSSLRQSCLKALNSFVQPEVNVDPPRLAAEVVFRTLLEYPTVTVGRLRDPTLVISHILSLVDHVLPQNSVSDDRWIMNIIPNTLFELTGFFDLLEPEKKVFVMTRLVKLDDGVTGVGEWLLIQELKQLSGIVESSHELHVVEHHQLYLSLHFLSKLIDASSQWLITTISNVPEVSTLLASCLIALLDIHVLCPALNEITGALAVRTESFSTELKSALVLTTLRAFHHKPWVLLDVLKQELPWQPADLQYAALLKLEIGQTLACVASGKVTPKLAGTAMSILEWLSEHTASLSGISSTALAQLYAKLAEALPASSRATLKTVTEVIQVDDNDAMPPDAVKLPERLELPFQEIINLLQNSAQPEVAPSTPKTSHTPDILGVLTSPSGLLRSPAATGLTKTYQKNDFRALRQAPAARLNTSRLPSMHVDVGVVLADS
ncbi:hypothetical protein MIND_00777900 [Mycena indigotica]|uniref:Virilizer N-terminal domain-containing protein n=1 Tax=Mycena indigotica TaxID=2126181 RepID=A0A8H6SNZ2_9AGAR|nr:uncharacterized protein MIND_00777900 [Mycena indigotica]KAF7302111.1 hypothetical protein MIND_00777900 [Mycena indigotica]